MGFQIFFVKLKNVYFQTKTVAGLFTKEKWFLALSLLNIVAAIGLTLYRLIYVAINDPTSTDFTFTLLIILNASKYVSWAVGDPEGVMLFD